MHKPYLKSMIFAAGLAFVSHTFAHGIWVEARRGNLEVVYGHGQSDDAYQTSRFHGAWGYDLAGNPVAIRVQSLDTHVRLLPQGTAAVITTALNNGYYARQADGKFVAQRKSQVPGATVGAGNWKYNLSILQKGAKLPSQFHGVRLLVLPEQDPTQVKVGASLPVRVLLDGKPVAGVKLTEDYKGNAQDKPIETDKDGRAHITVRNAGLNVIAASYTQKGSSDPEADEIWMNSTLTFLGAKP